MLTTSTKGNVWYVNAMLIVGLVSTKEEQSEIRLIAQIWMVRQRIRDIATESEEHPCHPKNHTIQRRLE